MNELVLWLDEALLVVNKPAGLPTLPDGYDPAAPHLRSLLEPGYGKLWIVHRLDRDTSGVVLLARNEEVHRSLNTRFEKREISKVYHALVSGNPDWDEKITRLPLRPDGDRKHRTVVDAQLGKPSETGLRVLERFGRWALVEAFPFTGRTHQIRVHLAALGLPVLADVLYGGEEAFWLSQISPGFQGKEIIDRPILTRSALHAWSLSLTHPSTGEPIHFTAPYPNDLAELIPLLRQYKTGPN